MQYNYLKRLTVSSMSLGLLFLNFSVKAEPILVNKDGGTDLSSVSVARIYFTGEVTAKKTVDLMQAIDNANINYKNLKQIYLYINSLGGDMDGAYAAYWSVRSSRVPVTAVNLGIVMSSATMIFCAAHQRESFHNSQFVLHSAAIAGGNYSFQPDQLERASRELKRYNEMFLSTYKDCTKFSDEELALILQSENYRKELAPDEALRKGLISKIADKIVDGSVSYFISNSQEKDNDN